MRCVLCRAIAASRHMRCWAMPLQALSFQGGRDCDAGLVSGPAAPHPRSVSYSNSTSARLFQCSSGTFRCSSRPWRELGPSISICRASDWRARWIASAVCVSGPLPVFWLGKKSAGPQLVVLDNATSCLDHDIDS